MAVGKGVIGRGWAEAAVVSGAEDWVSVGRGEDFWGG